MSNSTMVFYKGKQYEVVLRVGTMLFIRRTMNPRDCRWVHADLVMEL